MKIIKKILIIICVCMAICQISCKTFAYTLEEVKEMIDYKTVAEDGEPSSYDIIIDSSKLKDDEEIPIIQTSIDTIMYGNEGFLKILDINFLIPENSGNDPTWTIISNAVKTIFKITLYISAAILLTLLIYIAILIVSSGITQKDNKLPLNNLLNGKGKSIGKASVEKKLIEQWFSSVLILALLSAILNLFASFSNVITNIPNEYQITGQDDNYITVYVANLNGADDESTADIDTTGAYYFKTNLEGLLMFQSQYKWDLEPTKNAVSIVAGFIITVFKYFLGILFIFRMFILAVLTSVAPIIVLINGFKKISGESEILTKWTKIYLYCLLLRPVISIIYFMLVKSNIYLVSENPMYILFVILIIVLLFIVSLRWLLKNNKTKKK